MLYTVQYGNNGSTYCTHTILYGTVGNTVGTLVNEVTHILRVIGTPNAGETKT